MDGLSPPLLGAAAVFLAFVVWQFRPVIGFGRRQGASRAAVKDQMARVEAAASEPERAKALCDAADLLATRGARGLYLRALRADPASTEVVARVVAGLGKRPRVLEGVLWRHLGVAPWRDAREATRASLTALASLYEGPLRSGMRARALARARDFIDP